MNAASNSLFAESLARPQALIYHRTLAKRGCEDIEKCVAAGVLKLEPPLTELGWCSCEAEDCQRVVVRQDGRVYSVCPNSNHPYEEITEDHIRYYSFDEEEWLRRFAAANGIRFGLVEHTMRLTQIGTRAFPGGEAAVLLLRDILHDEVFILRMTLKVKHPDQPCILLVPTRPRLDEGDYATLTLDGYRMIVLSEAMATADGLRIEWPPLPVAAPTPAKRKPVRLVIHRGSKKASLDGMELLLQPRPFALLLFLAERATPEFLPVPSSSIFEEVWQTSSAADVDLFEIQVNDHASKVRKALRDALHLSPTEAQRLLLNEKGKGFCLAIPPEEIQIH